MKRILLTVLALSIGASMSFATGQGDTESIKIGAILAVTGGASFLGAPEAKTVEMLAEQINADGGIKGRKIELIIKDSAGDPEKALSFAKQLIEEDKVVAIIGPSTSGETMQIKDLCESYKTPLISCAAAEVIVDPVASYVFKTPQKDNYVAELIFKTMNDLGIKKIGVVAANTGFGNAGKDQLIKYAPQYGIEIALAETYDKAATDLTAVLTKIKAAGVQAVVNWSIVPAQSIVPKNMKQLGMNIPLFQSHGFGNIQYVIAAGEAANGIIFPAGRLLVADELPDSNPAESYPGGLQECLRSPVQRTNQHIRRPCLRCVHAGCRGGKKSRYHQPGQHSQGTRGNNRFPRYRRNLQLLERRSQRTGYRFS